ncbi:MAG TPA: OmpA family protein [Bacteroidales bacterium]|nr:OmpA family protein [Bacteroidales bacterium]
MRLHLRIFALLLLFFFAYQTQAQSLSTKSERAKKFFGNAQREFNLMNYALAKKYLKKAISIDENFLEAYMLLGDVHKSLIERKEAIEVYTKVLQKNAEKYPEVYYFMGLIYFELQQYPSAAKKFEYFLKTNTNHTDRLTDAAYLLECSKFAQKAVENPVPFEPVNVGNNINTAGNEYINSIRSDELQMYFTGNNTIHGQKANNDRFYFAERKTISENWNPSQLAPNPLNAVENQGAMSITPDGRFLLLTGCHWVNGYGSCDLYATEILEGKPGELKNLGAPPNSSQWDSQPSLAPDGRTLFFTSNRAGGFGKADIWKSRLMDDGTWSAPENLGNKINTPGDEMAPFIHADGKTLYFSSDRHIGMGGHDLYVSRLDEKGDWQSPENLGYPINTSDDQINIVVNTSGNKGYISANLPEGQGGFDIYSFQLHDEIRPHPVTYIKGLISDSRSQSPLEATLVLIDLETGKEIIRSSTDKKNGEFLICLPVNSDYALNVSSPGYLFYSENFSLTGINTEADPYQLNISLNPIKTGEATTLRNVFFDVDKADLLPESVAELTKLVEFLKMNTTLKIEIGGHTDNVGGETYNLNLSEKRAKAVVNFLVNNGIESQRLTWKGYGYSRPVSENTTEQGRAGNRRTEVLILEINQ